MISDAYAALRYAAPRYTAQCSADLYYAARNCSARNYADQRPVGFNLPRWNEVPCSGKWLSRRGEGRA